MRPSAAHVVGIDFSDGSARALRTAARLALAAGAPLHAVYADETHGTVHARAPEVLETDLRAFVRRAFDGDLPGVRFSYTIVRDLSPGLALSTYADQVDARLLVVGTHGRRGVRRLLLGSVANEVIRTAPCPVLTIPDTAEEAPEETIAMDATRRPILAPVDFSVAAEDGLRLARAWATRLHAPLVLLHVIDAGPYPAFYLPDLAEGYDLTRVLDERAQARMPRFYKQAVGTNLADDDTEVVTVVGRADVEVAAYAKTVGARLIVMATRGLTGLEHALLGSTTERVLRRAPCPVLTVRPTPVGDSTDDAAALRDDAVQLLRADLHLP